MSMDRPIRLPWWRKKLWLQSGIAAIVAVLLIATAVLFLGTPERSVRVAAASVTLGSVTQGPFHDFIPLRGKVVPMNTVYLDALEGGRVDRILAQAGDMVVQGQPLVELSNTELELDVLDREGRLVESITQLQTYETQLEQNRVANQKALALIDYDVIRLKRSAERRIILASADVEPVEVKDQIHRQMVKLQQDLKITHGKLDNLTVRAPVAGRLTALDLKVGENRNRGERFGEITPETGFKLATEVDEYYLGRVQNGQIADIEIGDKTWTLKVTRVYPKVTNGTFTVDFAFQGATPSGLLPGQALQGKLALGADRTAMILPAGAFLERTGGDWIFVLAKDGRSALRRTIKIGRRNTEQVEVLSGLAVGEQAIISDYTGLERIDRIDLKP